MQYLFDFDFWIRVCAILDFYSIYSKGNYLSSVYEHHKITGHKIDFDGIKILNRADSDPKIKVKEILHIDKKKSILNIQINSQTEFRYNVNIVGSKKKK